MAIRVVRFVLHRVLGGGLARLLAPNGKSRSELRLELEIEVPERP